MMNLAPCRTCKKPPTVYQTAGRVVIGCQGCDWLTTCVYGDEYQEVADAWNMENEGLDTLPEV